MAQTLTVTVDDGGTYTVDVRDVALFSDSGLTTPVTFPRAVSADTTTWYAAAPSGAGRRRVVVDVATAAGVHVSPPMTLGSLPATVSASSSTVDYSAPSSSGGSSAVGVGDTICLTGDGTRVSGMAQWQGVDADAPGDARSFTQVAAGLKVTEDCILAMTGTWYAGASGDNIYLAVLRDGSEIGPFWNGAQKIPASSPGSFSLTWALLADDVVTISALNDAAIGGFLYATRIG